MTIDVSDRPQGVTCIVCSCPIKKEGGVWLKDTLDIREDRVKCTTGGHHDPGIQTVRKKT